METGILDLLVNGSPMAAFAAFLIYLYRQQQSRMDALVDKFQNQLEDIRKEYKDDVDKLRGRYDAVITDQNTERDQLKDKIAIRLKEVDTSIQSMQKSLSQLLVTQEVEKDDILTISKNVEQGLEIMKKMQDEAKLKEIARQTLQQK